MDFDFMHIFLVLGLLLVIRQYYEFARARKLDYVQTCSGWSPFFGHLFPIVKNYHRLHDHMMDMAKEADYAPYTSGLTRFFVHGFPTLFVGARDPKNVEHFLKNEFKRYQKPKHFKLAFAEVFGNGIFASDAEPWRHSRKLASFIFTARSLKGTMTQIFNETTHELREVLDNAADNGSTLDIQQRFFDYTMSAFLEIAFGEKSYLLSGKPGKAERARHFARSFDEAQRISTWRMSQPLWRLMKFLKVGNERAMVYHVRVLDEFAAYIVQMRRNAFKEGETSSTDLISLFLRNEKEYNISDEELRDVVINFLVAGRDTTAVLLTWCIYRLCKHPKWEERILEIVQAGRAAGKTYEQLATNSEVQAYLLEVLRLHPSVPQDVKECVEDDVWPDGTKVPAGTEIMYSPMIAGQSPYLWGNDVSEFKPERFIDSNSNTGLKEVSQYLYPVFNGGPRICLGKNLALYEAGHLLVELVHNYRFFLVSQADPKPLITVTLSIQGGLPITVQKRGFTQTAS